MSDAMKLEFLRDSFGFPGFKCEFQKAGFEAILSGNKNVIISMKSLGGKTLCYQMAGAFQIEKMMVVICSSLATLTHQKAYLNELGFIAESINSTVDYGKRDEIFDELQSTNCSIKFFFVTPEMLDSNCSLRNVIQNLCETDRVSHVIVDDVHLMVPEIGIRPAFEVLQKFKEKTLNTSWVFIGSCTQVMILQIQEAFGLTNAIIIRGPSKRSDLFLQVKLIEPTQRLEALMTDINRHTKGGKVPSGIVYVDAMSETTEVAIYLNENGIVAKPYHAKLETRDAILDEWVKEEFPVIVATDQSLGFGNVKIPVKFVLHYKTPESLELFYHLSGRAFDDGKVVWAHFYYDKLHLHISYLNRFISAGCRHKEFARLYGETVDNCVNMCDHCVQIGKKTK